MSTLGPHFEYILDHDWKLQVSDFVDRSKLQLQPLPGLVPDFGYTPALIWLRVDLQNASQTDTWRFFVQANFTQQIALYRIDPSGEVTTLMDLGPDSPFSDRPVDFPQMVADFQLATGAEATLVLAYYSQGSSRVTMSIETLPSFVAEARLFEAKAFAFYGMMLVMISLALLALVALRQVIFAAYAGYLSAMLLYVLHADGFAFQFLWPNFPAFNSMASVVAGTAVMVTGGLFAVCFLQTRRYHPVMHRIVLSAMAMVLVVDAVLWAINPQLLKQFLVVMILICALTWFASAIVAARTRFKEVRFYLLAWGAAVIPAALFTGRFAFGWATELITPFDAVRLALAMDALLMGVAMFDRYNQARQAAAAENLAQAQASLALGTRLSLLEDRYAQVQLLAQRREEGVQNTVHDLRQPMHALRLSLRQLFSAQNEGGNDVRQVESALAYMEKLVAERLDAPEAEPAAKAADATGLHAVLRAAVDMFAPEAQAKGLSLKLVLAAPDAPVEAYPLMRVVANLVSNAIKYTPSGRVVVGLRRSGSGHRIEVHDSGPGLAGAAFAQALGRSQRLERDLDAAEGSGLGLSVANEIAQANGWILSASSARRTGASLRVELPGVAVAAEKTKVLA